MKRITKIFIVAALFVATATTSASAQIYYGVKAGANVSSTSISGMEEIGFDEAQSAYGYQAGVVLGAKIPIIGIGIEAEGLWVNNKLTFTDGADITSNSIEIPVMASIPLLPMLPIALKVGPTFMVYNDAKVKYDNGTTLGLDPIKSTVGYTVGLGLNILKFTLDVRFNGQFKGSNPFENVISGLENTASSYDLRTNTFSASVGYRF